MALEDTKPNDDNFSAAFERLAELGETNAKADNDAMNDVAPTDEPEVDADEGATQEADIDTDIDADEPEAAEADDDGAEEPEPEPQQAQESDEELLARLASLVKKAPVQEEPAQSATEEVEPQAVLSADELEFLQEYEKDWPDVARAEALRRKAEYHELVGYVFQEVAKELGPVMEAVRAMSTRVHLQDLQETVTDYDDVRDKVIDWVATQPAYLQPAYNHVIQNGTVDEVADLIDRYREATGAQLRAPAASKKEPELPTATKQAAASLAPVSSKRSAVLQADDPNDFESAFETFADKV